MGNKDALLGDKDGLSGRVSLHGLQIVLAEILAPNGQLVVLQMGQDLLQLEEEAFAWFVTVGIHVKMG